MTQTELWLAVAVMALVTALTRYLPFIAFGGGRKIPKVVKKLGGLLPYAIMGMLVVYCLKGVTFTSGLGGFMPETISVLAVSVLYVWKRNSLFSITAGTVCYMLLVQLVF